MNADEVNDVLLGERDGKMLITVLRVTLGDGDEIFRVIERIGGNPARLRGCCRVLQREFEGWPKGVSR